MKKNRIALLIASTLLTAGMTFANRAALPGTAQTEATALAAAAPASELPGVGKIQEVVNAGIGHAGERPGTGVQSGLRGSAMSNHALLPGVESAPSLQ